MYDSKHYRPVSTNIWAISFPLSIFTYVFQHFQIFSFLGSVSDGHLSEHQKRHPWLWWNYCQTIQTSRNTTIDDLFLYQMLISRYLHLPYYSTVQLLCLLDQKVRFSITSAIKCPSLTLFFQLTKNHIQSLLKIVWEMNLEIIRAIVVKNIISQYMLFTKSICGQF